MGLILTSCATVTNYGGVVRKNFKEIKVPEQEPSLRVIMPEKRDRLWLTCQND